MRVRQKRNMALGTTSFSLCFGCSVPVPPVPPTNAPPGSPGRQGAITMAIWTQIPHRAVRCEWHVLRWGGTKCQSDRVFSCCCFSPPCSRVLFPDPIFCSDDREFWREIVLDLLSWFKKKKKRNYKIERKPSLVDIRWNSICSPKLNRMCFYPNFHVSDLVFGSIWRCVPHIYVNIGCISTKHKSFLSYTHFPLSLCVPVLSALESWSFSTTKQHFAPKRGSHCQAENWF